MERIEMVDGLYRRCLRKNHTSDSFRIEKALNRSCTDHQQIDKPSAHPAEMMVKSWRLFIELGADDDIDFPVVYASAINGILLDRMIS